MTFKEKLTKEHPDKLSSECEGGCSACPHTYGYEKPQYGTDWCLNHTCEECWNREMPVLKIDEVYEEKLANETNPMWPKENPHILDSGERQQFETGAVRDIQKGKGRCDLMPLRVLAYIWRTIDTDSVQDGVDKAQVFEHIADYQDTGDVQRLVFAINSFTGYLDWPTAFLEVSKHFEEGAEKYGENNWQKGLPVGCYINSAIRHYIKWLRGDNDEPHDRAFVWNLLCCIWELKFSPRATSKNEQDAPIMVLEHADGPRSQRVTYLCDKHACTTCDNPECHQTEDVSHAVNFESVGGGVFVERCGPKLLLKDVAPGVYEALGFTCLKGEDSVVYNMATGRPVDIAGLTFCQKLSIHNVYPGAEGLTLSTAPGGALFYHEGDAWLATTDNSNTEFVYAVRLRDGKFKYLTGTTRVASIEDIDFKLH